MKVPAKRKRIALYGLFGQNNIGNECTLQAILHNLRRFFPDADLICICTDPSDTSQRHKIRAFPISNRYSKGYPAESRRRRNRGIALLQRVFVRTPREIWNWVQGFRALKQFDMLIVPGTGLLTDYTSSPFGIPYRILKWATLARLRGCKLLFVSVGAGPMYHPWTKWILRRALSMAHYRSYRDQYSKEFLESIGFNAQGDSLYPDLAFSLPSDLFSAHHPRVSRKQVIGLGVKDYSGKLGLQGREGDLKNQTFFRKLTELVAWLLGNGYGVRLLVGDTLYDEHVRRDLIEAVRSSDSKLDVSQLISAPVCSLDELLEELNRCDVVISARFHNILLAFMLGKPAVSLSYHDKFAALMSSVGLASYCHDIDTLDVNDVAAQVRELACEAKPLEAQIRMQVERNREALNEQYDRIFVS